MSSLPEILRSLRAKAARPATAPRTTRRFWFVAGLALLGIGVSITSFIVQYQTDQKNDLATMALQVSQRASWLQDDIEDNFAMVGDLQSYFDVLGGVPSRDEFSPLAARQTAPDNGLRAVYWVPRLADRFPVAYAEPETEREKIDGEDLAADPRWREAMARARDTGSIVALSASDPRDAPADRRSIFVIGAVYGHRLTDSDVGERQAALTGYVVGLIRLDALIELRAADGDSEHGLDEYFFAGPSAAPENLIYVHPSRWRSATFLPAPFDRTEEYPRWTRTASVGDFAVTMTAVAPPELHPFAPATEDLATLFAGLLITGFLGQYLILGVRRTRELEHRDAILHAVSRSVAAMQTAPSFAEGMSEALRIVGEAFGVDRVLVLENMRPDDPIPNVSLCYAWEAPDIEVRVDPAFISNSPSADLASWYAPLSEDKPVIDSIRTAKGAAAKLLETLKIKSILLVPIRVEGKLWGNIGIDACKAERRWTRAEIDALRTLAEVIGSSVVRERFTTQLSDANKIVNSSPTVLYRLKGVVGLPLIFVSGNVSWFGHRAADLLADPLLYQKIIHPDDFTNVARLMGEAFTPDGKSESGSVEYRIRKGDSYCWVESRFRPILNADGNLKEIEGILTDINERKEAEAQIVQMARHDGLTDLANRRLFVETAQQAIARMRRGENPFAVLYLDLDHFKDVNDTLGHPVGDELLKTVAGRLRASVRETDLVARFGGDEFAILQTNLGDPADAGTLATKLLETVAQPYSIGGSVIHIGTSIGIAVSDPDAPDLETLLSHADVALYRAKSEGRGQYRFFTAAMDDEVRSRFALAADLRVAVAANQLFLLYQPLVEIVTGRIIGAEALVRWHHPRFGLLAPSEFIGAAEKSGLIAMLGQWVLAEACRQTKSWIDAGIAFAATAVNVSSFQFKAPRELEALIAATLERNALEPRHLEIELTETALMETSLDNNDLLQRLQKRGIKLAIDDFGTGYSSLNYLRQFPVDRIKIAQHFVADLITDPGAAAIVKATIGLARELKLDVIAEGVETAEQLALLHSWGCRSAQGFYFAEPMTAEQIEPLLRQGVIYRGGNRLAAAS
jgi:diguanylate cyclase (GGDEF)-like protein/PAS domain S-box-containing protein